MILAVGKVFVITGPSGVGKGTLIERLLERIPELEVSISATTREPRPGEVNGRDYHFLSPEEFRRRLEAGDFLEHASYSGNYYGTLRSEVEQRVERCRSVVLEIEVQGARQVRDALGDEAVLIFIAPPDEAVLRERLESRGTDSGEAIEQRLRTAEVELAARSEFPLEVVNDDLQKATSELEGLVRGRLSLH
ncbi:MAG TPA: guanylate kinase [Solirubrobacterales bacterium]|nr:guanylate kinase [Solirubrobacterales bacterium]